MSMTLLEAIKHAEEVAETQEENCKHAGHDHYTKLEASACAAEHRQANTMEFVDQLYMPVVQENQKEVNLV